MMLADEPVPTTEQPVDKFSDEFDDDILPNARDSISQQLAGLVDMGRSTSLSYFPFFSF